MKKLLFVSAVFVAITVFGTVAFGDKDKGEKTGEALFKQNCAVCHPEGGNIINPQKTLMKKNRDANSIRGAADIVKIMRNPGPGMTRFDEKAIPDKDAGEIAEYILKSYK